MPGNRKRNGNNAPRFCWRCGGYDDGPDHRFTCDGQQGRVEAAELPTPVVIARHSDPETCHDAAAMLNAKPERLTRSVTTVVELLQHYGKQTDFQIRERWAEFWEGPFSYTLPCKARLWACQAGLVRWSGERVRNESSKYSVRVWELST